MPNLIGQEAGSNAVSCHDKSPYAIALLLNDTSFWYHWGCSCTSLAIHEQLRRRGYSVLSCPVNEMHRLTNLPASLVDFDNDAIYDRFCIGNENVVNRIRRSHVVVINGEGTLHGMSPAVLGILYLAYIAKTRLAKPVHLINHSCYPEDTTEVAEGPIANLYRKVYEQLDVVAVREGVSAGVLERMGIRVVRSFDCLPLFVRDHYGARARHEEKRIVIAGGVAWGGEVASSIGALIEKISRDGYKIEILVGANAYPAADDWAFVRSLRDHIGKRAELINATSEREWLDAIHHASVLISGRFHHSIAAAFLGTPFIITESNTPKNIGMMRMLGMETMLSVMDSNLSESLHSLSMRLIEEPHWGMVPAAVLDQAQQLSLRNFHGLGERRL